MTTFRQTFDNWALPITVGVAVLGTCAATNPVTSQKNAMKTPQELAETAVREHYLLATIGYEDVCGAHPIRPAGSVFTLPKGNIVEGKPECGKDKAVVLFDTNINGIHQNVYVAMRPDRRMERSYSFTRPKPAYSF